MRPLAFGARCRELRGPIRGLGVALLASTLCTTIPISADPSAAVGELLHSLDPPLRAVVVDALDRSPELAAHRARIEALQTLPKQARALPDPTASLSFFAAPPETRVGPQQLSLGARQKVPWPERRRLAGQRAELIAQRAELDLVEAQLGLLLRAREIWIELAFLDIQTAILDDQRQHLELHEAAARARYATGIGPASGPIRLQAATTRLQTQRLEIADRRAGLAAELAALRDRSVFTADGQTGPPSLPAPPAEGLMADADGDSIDRLVAIALQRRAETRRARLDRQMASLGLAVAETNHRPDLELGVMWTRVEPRDDAVGRANPPAGNGDDIVALTAGVTVPWDRGRRQAELTEAAALEILAGAEERQVDGHVRRRIEALAARLPIEARQLTLLRDVLLIQAQEAVDSAIAGYRAGSLQALDLLDAEHRLYDVRLAVARTRADLALTVARLEDAVATPWTRFGPLSEPQANRQAADQEPKDD